MDKGNETVLSAIYPFVHHQADAVEIAAKQNAQLLLLLQREEGNSQKLRSDT